MLASIRSGTLVGVEALAVDVEVDVAPGLPAIEIVGLPNTAIREARDRVRTALKNSGFSLPPGRITVNLAPAHVPKTGTLFDLPIALGILVAGNLLRPTVNLNKVVVVGELSLNGMLRPVNGTLCIASKFRGTDVTLLVPEENVREVQLIPDVRVIGLRWLKDLTMLQLNQLVPCERNSNDYAVSPETDAEATATWSQIKGQATAKRVLEIAVAGGHHVLFMGPPGSGKTMLARTLTALAKPLTIDEAIEVTEIYSVAGLLNADQPFVRARPFRAPHHTITPAGLLGGGTPVRPGEISLAHRGFLFLDEFPELQPYVIEALRQPLESGEVVLTRSGQTIRFPASFTLVAAANPCPCGFLGDPHHPCVCTDYALNKYRRKLSGPIADRIDLLLSVHRPSIDDVLGESNEDAPLEIVRDKIQKARGTQKRRFSHGQRTNAVMTPGEVRKFVRLDRKGEAILRRAAQRWHLSPRAIHRILKVSRTIADLQGEKIVTANFLAEALSYRLNR